MRAAWVLAALLSHWRRRRMELATLLVGLMAATALWSGVQALNAEARASYGRASALLGGDRLAGIAARDSGRFAVEDFVALRRQGWQVSPLLEGDLALDGTRLRVIGVEPLSLPPEAESFAIGPGAERLGAFLSREGLGIVSAETLARLDGEAGLPPLVADAEAPPDVLLVDMAVAERLLDAHGEVSRLILAPSEADSGRPLPAPLDARLEIRPPEREGELERLTDSFHLNLTAFGFLSFVVGLFIAYAAIGLAFEQRRPLLRTLRACGVSARLLAAALLGELLAIALVAGLAGVAAGYLIAASLLPDVAASLRGLYGARVPGSLTLAPSWWAAGLAMSLAGALAAGASSLWRAWRLPLLATAQPQAWLAAERRRLRLQGGFAGAAALACAAALAAGGGLGAAFAAMAALIVAAALLLPAALAAVLALAERAARGPVAAWVWADSRQNLPGLSLALTALLIALAVNVGVGSMVEGFRRTFVGWLDQRLAAEVYVTARDAAEAERLAAWLEARPEVRAILPIWSVEGRIAGWPSEIYGFRDHETYRDNWPLLALARGGWDAVAAGEAALVSEQVARRAGLSPGDPLTLPTPAGPWETRVAGVYTDYGNPEGQAMIALHELERRWPEVERLRYALRVEPAAVPALTAALAAEFGIGEDRLIDQAALKAFSLRVFDRTFAVTVALNALTLAVAGVALLTSLLALSGLRVAQLAPLWAMGMTRRSLAAIEIGRTLALAALTAVAALPVGLAIAWLLTAVINVEAFGWRLPLGVFPGQWGALFALALATALAAALWPAILLGRSSPLDLLRSFSNER